MTAIFTGLGSGFERGSGSVLGGSGLFGSPTLGRGGEDVFVNARTGNLLISQQDEFLVGLGPDVAISRTYNSLGDLSDENGDNWRQSTQRRIINLTGTLNTAGSTVQRVGADGTVITYTWDVAKNAYAATDGGGSYDTLTNSGGVWRWRDGDTQITETYALEYGSTTAWRITSQTDTDGNALTFTYVANSDHLDKVTTQDGSWVQYSWTGNNISQIVTGYTDLATSTAKTLTRTRYTYDAQNRLSTVTVDLSPGDNSVADGATYTTTYTYDASNRVNSISQSDGSRIDLTYYGTGELYTIAQTTSTGVTRTTTLQYSTIDGSGNRTTTITDQLGQQVTLVSDVKGQLTEVRTPATVVGGPQQYTQYTYDPTTDDVTKVASGTVSGNAYTENHATTYSGFVNGLAGTVTDSLGNVISRTFDANNRVVTETTTSSDADSPAAQHTTRYVYDSENHLKYRVSAEGNVTWFTYTAAGLNWTTNECAERFYDVSGLSPSTALTEAQVDSWINGTTDWTGVKLTENGYDARGNLQQLNHYSLNAGGGQNAAELSQRTVYTYDQSGNLLSRFQDGRSTETFVYDGLGRLVSAVDLNGGTTTYAFNDANTTTTVTFATGLVQTSTYNKAGELLSFTEGGTATTPAPVTGSATYGYDQLGQMRWQVDATGRKIYHLYDALGRKVADISKDLTSGLGEITEYKFDADNRLVATVSHTNTLSAAQLTALDNLNAAADIANYRPAGAATDLWSWRIYDKESRLLQVIDGMGSTTVNSYDGGGRLIQSTTYFNKIAAGTLTGFKTTLPTAVTVPVTDSARDAVSRNFYDKDGRLIGTLDGEGFVTKYIYDRAGYKVEDIAYANASLAADRASATLTTILSHIAADATHDQHTHYVYNGQGQLRFVVDSNFHVTETRYAVGDGQVTTTIRYANAISSSTTDFTWDNLDALVAALGSGRATYAVYDSSGRLAYSIDAAGGVTKLTYNASGQVTKSVQFATVRSTSSLPDQATMDSWATTNANSTTDHTTRNYYDGTGTLRYVVDGEGFVTRRTEDAEGRLTLIERFANANTTINDSTTLSALHSWVSASGGASANTSTTYDVDGRVAAVTDAENNVTTFAYNTNGTLLSKTLGGSTITYSYDGAGRVTSEDRAGLATIQYGYDGFGNVVKVTDARGTITYNYYDRTGNLTLACDDATGLKYVTERTYNAFGEITSETRRYKSASNSPNETTPPAVVADPTHDAVTFNYYNALGQLTKTCDAQKYVTETTYTVFGEVYTVKRYYNAASNTPSVTVEPTVTADALHDATTQYAYDGLSRVKSILDANLKLEIYNLDAFGNRIWVTNKLNGTTINSYDRRGLLISETLPMASVDSNGNQVASTVTNKFSYDARGNRTQMIEAFGLAEQRTTNYEYDKLDRLTRKYGDAVTTLAYNDFTATTAVTVISTSGVIPEERYVYDARGNVTQMTDANGAKTFSYYDALNRKTAEVGSLGTLKSWTYDANGNNLTERVYGDFVALPGAPGGNPPNPVNGSNYRETVYTYDPLNRLSTTSVANVLVGTWSAANNGVSTSTTSVGSSLSYDAFGNVITATDANGNKVYSWYDKLGRKTGQIDQENYLTSWTYDSGGNVASETRFANKYVGTPDATVYPAPTVTADAANDRATSFTYDKMGHRLTETRTGVLAWTVNPTNGQLTAASTSSQVIYTYNGLGQVLTKREATGDTVTYTYDQTGRLLQERRASYTDVTDNRVSNSQYNGTAGWTVDNPNAIVSGAIVAGSASGTTYLKANLAATASGQTATLRTDDTHSVTVTAGERLFVQVGVEVVGTGGDVQLVADYLNASGTLLSSSTIGTLSGPQAFNTKIGGVVTVPANAVKIRLKLIRHTTVAGSGSFSMIEPIVEKVTASQTNNVVTPTVNYFYNGLNNLSRTEQVGSASQANRVTTYSYGAGGRLLSMVDPTGITGTHTYDYDAAGNQVRDSYTRAKSDTNTVNEAILYRRDLLGRVITQTIATNNAGTWTRGDSQNTQYDAYGEVSQRGVNGLWQESFTYNNRGLVEKTNTGDGVWRFYVYDKQGNQVLAVESEGKDYSASTLANALTDVGTYANSYLTTVGVNATITVYDKRNQAIQVRLPQRETTAQNTLLTTIVTSQSYNAFGEFASQTDALNNVTTLTYNTMGRLIQKVMPQVSVTSTTGVVSNVNPTQCYYFDLSGRLVGSADANGFTTNYAITAASATTQTLLAGTGYNGSDALVTAEYHRDGGIKKTFYDVFGDARIMRDELLRDETRTYDTMGRVATIVRRTGLQEAFTYDLLGQQVKHVLKDTVNTVLGTETTDYDVQGRVTKTVDQAGDTTTYAYAWQAGLTNSGMSGAAVIGGWLTTTTMWQQLGSASWKQKTETADVHGLTTSQTDLGGHTTNFTYDRAGRLTQKQGTVGAIVTTLTNTFYNSGLTATVVDSSTGMTANAITSTYKYDVMGRRTAEKYAGTVYKSQTSPEDWSVLMATTQTLQDATITYNALGWMTGFSSTSSSGSATINQYYDAAGNIRRTLTTYPNLVAGGTTSSDKWFTYDAMNRMVVVNGAFNGTAIVTEDTNGALTLAYDVVGNRKSAATKYSDVIIIDENTGKTKTVHLTDYEYYNYDNDNQLTTVLAGTTMTASTTRDIRGRVTEYVEYAAGAPSGIANHRYNIVYNARGQVASESDFQWVNNGDDIPATITNTYDAYGNMTYTHAVNGNGLKDTWQSWTIGWYDSAVNAHSDYDKDYYGSNNLWTSDSYYDGLGRLQRTKIQDGDPRYIHFALNPDNEVVSRVIDQGNPDDPRDYHLFVSGQQVGEYTNNANEDTRNYDYNQLINTKINPGSGSSEFYQGGSAVSGAEMGTSGYDPINPITAGVNQNSRSRYTVQSGDTLQGIAQALWGDSSLWYKLAEANGLSADSTLTSGEALSVPLQGPSNRSNADMFRPYDASSAVGDLNPTSAKPPKKGKCGVFGQILLTAIAIAVSVALPGGGTVIGAAVNAMIGSAVSQAVGVATGIQSSFSFKSIALAGLTAGVTAGIGDVIGKGAMFGSKFAGDVVRGAVGSAVTQGVAVATGLQEKFDWAGVAAAGVSAGIGGALGRTSFMTNVGQQFGKAGVSFVGGMARDVANAATRSLIEGSSFGDNMLAGLPDVIGQTLVAATQDGIAAIKAHEEAQKERATRSMESTGGAIAAPGSTGQTDPNGIVVNVRGLKGLNIMTPEMKIDFLEATGRLSPERAAILRTQVHDLKVGLRDQYIADNNIVVPVASTQVDSNGLQYVPTETHTYAIDQSTLDQWSQTYDDNYVEGVNSPVGRDEFRKAIANNRDLVRQWDAAADHEITIFMTLSLGVPIVVGAGGALAPVIGEGVGSFSTRFLAPRVGQIVATTTEYGIVGGANGGAEAMKEYVIDGRIDPWKVSIASVTGMAGRGLEARGLPAPIAYPSTAAAGNIATQEYDMHYNGQGGFDFTELSLTTAVSLAGTQLPKGSISLYEPPTVQPPNSVIGGLRAGAINGGNAIVGDGAGMISDQVISGTYDKTKDH